MKSTEINEIRTYDIHLHVILTTDIIAQALAIGLCNTFSVYKPVVIVSPAQIDEAQYSECRPCRLHL